MRRSWPHRPATLTLPLVLVLGLLPTGAIQASTHTLITQERGIFSRVNAVEAGSAAELARADEAIDFALYNAFHLPQVSTAGATTGTQAVIGSDVVESDLFGNASVSAIATATMPVVRAEASADAFFDVVFEPTGATTYELIGLLDVATTFGIANARVELIDVGDGAVLASHSVDAIGHENISDTGSMTGGLQYRLRASAVVDASVDTLPGTSLADASYQVTLTLPEPVRDTALLAGVLLVIALRRRGP